MLDTQDATEFVTQARLREKDSSAERKGWEPTLVVIAHPAPEMLGSRFYPYRDAETQVGRSLDSQVFVGDVPSVSRLHAVLEWREESVWLRDLDSTNGTYVNDRRITEPTELANGDRLQLGVVHMKFLQQEDVERAYHEAMYELASTDGLTELANRRRFDEELPREIVRAERYGRPLSLMLVDLDEFKAINDSRGHVAGDAILKHVGRICRQVSRKEQCVARLGGDELAILCPETTAENAKVLAERIREALAAAPLSWEGSKIYVTLSIGIAELDLDQVRPAALYSAADRALYRAKQAGRDRVSL